MQNDLLFILVLLFGAHEELERYHYVLRDIYARELFKHCKEKAFSDEVIRQPELQLDLDKARVSNHSIYN